MKINTNELNIKLNRLNRKNNRKRSSSTEKLASGFRINRAADDAAGLAISEKMRGQINGLNQATRNAQDATSLIQTAEGALNESHEILQRMRELAVQSANDTYSQEDRDDIQEEINQLTEELDRIAETTKFNTKGLLDGSFKENVFQIGANEGQSTELSIDDMNVEALGVINETINMGKSGNGVLDATADFDFDPSSFQLSAEKNGAVAAKVSEKIGTLLPKSVKDIEDISAESDWKTNMTAEIQGEYRFDILAGFNNGATVNFAGQSYEYQEDGSGDFTGDNSRAIANSLASAINNEDRFIAYSSREDNTVRIKEVVGQVTGNDPAGPDTSRIGNFSIQTNSTLADDANANFVDEKIEININELYQSAKSIKIKGTDLDSAYNDAKGVAATWANTYTITSKSGAKYNDYLFALENSEIDGNQVSIIEEVLGEKYTILAGNDATGDDVEAALEAYFGSEWSVDDDRLGGEFTGEMILIDGGVDASMTVTVYDDVDQTGSVLSEFIKTYDSVQTTFEYNNHGISFNLNREDAANFELNKNLEYLPETYIVPVEGENGETLNLNVTNTDGSDVSFSVNFEQGTYTMQEIIDEINNVAAEFGVGNDIAKSDNDGRITITSQYQGENSRVVVDNEEGEINIDVDSTGFDASIDFIFQSKDAKHAKASLQGVDVISRIPGIDANNYNLIFVSADTQTNETTATFDEEAGELKVLLAHDSEDITATQGEVAEAINSIKKFSAKAINIDSIVNSGFTNFSGGKGKVDFKESITPQDTSIDFLDAKMRFELKELESLEAIDVKTYFTASVFSRAGGIDVSSFEAANGAITVLTQAIETVSSQRSELGAIQNKLKHTIANLEVASENLTIAESRIRDADLAQEMMEFSRQHILEQAGISMLAQANQTQQSVLQLLG